jgi:hypothetical protein
MRARIVAKLASGLVLGLIWFGVGVWISQTYYHARGRQGFLALQAQRFDKSYADPHGIYAAREVLSAIVFIALIISFYELLALAFYKLICFLQQQGDRREET